MPWTVVATASRARNAGTARSRGAFAPAPLAALKAYPKAYLKAYPKAFPKSFLNALGRAFRAANGAPSFGENDGQSERLLRTAPSSALTCAGKRRGQLWQRRAVCGAPGPLAPAALRAASLAALKAYLKAYPKAYPKAFPKSFLNALGRAFRAANDAPEFGRIPARVSG
jgi:hypothetical protein